MVSEPNKMTAAHSIAVEANHKTLKLIKKTTATRATAGDPGHVGRDYSTFVSMRNHSPLMKKRPSHGTLLVEGGVASCHVTREEAQAWAESHLVCLLYLVSRKTTLSISTLSLIKCS